MKEILCSRLFCFVILTLATFFLSPKAFSDPAPKPNLTGQVVSVAAGGPEGFRIVTVDKLTANSNIVLEAYGTIKGILKRPSGSGKGEDLDVDFDVSPSHNGIILNLAHHSVTDADGKFEFTRVPAGRLHISYRIKMGKGSWRQEPLKQVSLKPEETLEVNINASEKAPTPP